jgi:hypothetical protein
MKETACLFLYNIGQAGLETIFDGIIVNYRWNLFGMAVN